MVYWIFGTNTSCPSKAMQNGILSIIQAINKPNCWQEALIMYLVSENELSKPNQFRCLEIHRFLTLNWSKTGLWLAQKTHDLQNQGDLILWKPINHHRTQMMMFWRRYNDLFTRCLNFSLIYIHFHVTFTSLLQAWKVTIFCQAHFFISLPDILSLPKGSLTYNLCLTL